MFSVMIITGDLYSKDPIPADKTAEAKADKWQPVLRKGDITVEADKFAILTGKFEKTEIKFLRWLDCTVDG